MRIVPRFIIILGLVWVSGYPIRAAEQKVMPNVTGMSLNQGLNVLAEAGVANIVYSPPRPTREKSQDFKIYSQTPAPGQKITGMVLIGYYQFQGIMPYVIGLSLDKAKKILEEAGASGHMITLNTIPTSTPGLDQKIFAQTPVPGEPITGIIFLDVYQSNL